MSMASVQSKESAESYVKRVGVQELLENLALAILRDRPDDPREYLGTILKPKCMENHYPRDLEAVTTKWISDLVGAKVESFTTKVLDQGIMSDAAIIQPVYEKASECSLTSFVLKFAKSTVEGRGVAAACHMYPTELSFYAKLRDDVHKFVPCPTILGQFRDPQEPDLWFCIAMQDLSVEYEPLNGVTGISFEDSQNLLRKVATMHAHFWQKPVCEEAWLNRKDREGVQDPFWFGPWYQDFVDAGPKDLATKWFSCLRDTTGVDMMTAEMFPLMDLIFDHAAALRKAVIAKLKGRPKTIVHGDLRSDNLFRSKNNNLDFVVIDWQAVAGCSPGIEFVQLLSGMLEPESCFDNLDQLYDTYLTVLYEKCPEARQTYTKDMLNEDFALSTTLWIMALCPMFYAVAAPNAAHPIWAVLKPGYARFKKCLIATKAADLCVAVAKEAGIIR